MDYRQTEVWKAVAEILRLNSRQQHVSLDHMVLKPADPSDLVTTY